MDTEACEKVTLQLYKARDAEEAYALRFPQEDRWLARTGFGSHLNLVWTIEVQSEVAMDRTSVNWEAVLKRAIEAHRLNDPVLTNFEWPRQGA